jgi:hypothetical protein
LFHQTGDLFAVITRERCGGPELFHCDDWKEGHYEPATLSKHTPEFAKYGRGIRPEVNRMDRARLRELVASEWHGIRARASKLDSP